MNVPENFYFPFPPYPIQINFMKHLYQCLENSQFGIFESPTGTGKTLSIICGTLKWLLDHEESNKQILLDKKKKIEDKIDEISKKSSEDWFTVQTEQINLVKEKQEIESKLLSISKQEDKLNNYKKLITNYEKNNTDKSQNFNKWKEKKNIEENKSVEKNEFENKELDNDLVLLETDENYEHDSEDEELENEYEGCKIFFCSRTHSQLSQFVEELKKSQFADKISLVPLGSRTNYCINPVIKSLKNINLINEQCLQLQKKKSVKKEKEIKKSKSSTCCPFQPGNQQLLMAEILTNIRDIEDTVKKSEELKTCPYYSTRKSVIDAKIIAVPYNTILHKSTRISSGINLKNNILIIDEAHNLLEAIEQMHCVTITGNHILCSLNQLSQYQKRFETLLSPKNVLLITQLSFCLRKLIKLLGGNSKSKSSDKPSDGIKSKLYTLQDFETFAEIDTINIFELIQFIKKSKLVHKLKNYIENFNDEISKPTVKKKSGVTSYLETLKNKKSSNLIKKDDNNENISPLEKENLSCPLNIITNFLETLNSNCSDGRIFIIPKESIGEGYLKFLLLNPAAHFTDIVKEARAIILAGGTMEPITEFIDQLFISAGAEPERIVTFSCDHIIPKENILTNIVKTGPTGIEFEFNYQNRQNIKMLDELGRVFVNLCNIVPAGIVVFLPSYNFEEMLLKHLETTGVLKKISIKKFIFREPKTSSQVNQILSKYSNAIKNPQKPQNGAILFSVVGGKLSEGLNFSDDLGRCIIVVGMPYPNIRSLELEEKMKYLNENVKSDAGKIYYENSCMKAVNQCIGRAVRHINDYSTVVLLDKRYANKTKSLPNWIQRTLVLHNTFNTAIGSIAKFFVSKKKKNC